MVTHAEDLQMFGNRLATERKRLGLSQKDVGERLGIGRSADGMIETDRAPLDAERLLKLGTDGFDVLYILTGELGTVAAGRLIDWELCMAITERVDEWAANRGIRVPLGKKAIIVKHLYVQLAERGLIDESTLDETLRMAA